MFEPSSWRGASNRLWLDRCLGAWDEVLCGDSFFCEGLPPDELSQMLFNRCGARYAFRSFAAADELLERYDLLSRFYKHPLEFDELGLRGLAQMYLAQMVPFAKECDCPELIAMTKNPILFENVGESFVGEGNQLWREVIGWWRREVREGLAAPLIGEVNTLSELLREHAWAPELGDALIGPLYPIQGYDSGLYLQCWIRNAAVVIESDAIRVSKRIEGR